MVGVAHRTAAALGFNALAAASCSGRKTTPASVGRLICKNPRMRWRVCGSLTSDKEAKVDDSQEMKAGDPIGQTLADLDAMLGIVDEKKEEHEEKKREVGFRVLSPLPKPELAVSLPPHFHTHAPVCRSSGAG
jgi:hypothetical protein